MVIEHLLQEIQGMEYFLLPHKNTAQLLTNQITVFLGCFTWSGDNMIYALNIDGVENPIVE